MCSTLWFQGIFIPPPPRKVSGGEVGSQKAKVLKEGYVAKKYFHWSYDMEQHIHISLHGSDALIGELYRLITIKF